VVFSAIRTTRRTAVSYQFQGIDPARFAALAALTEAELAAAGVVVRVVAPGERAPCRLTLENAPAGETVFLLNHTHQPTTSPYGARGPIFIRRDALGGAAVVTTTLPPMLAGRTLSVRAYDDAGMIVDGEVVEPDALADHLAALFARADVVEVHLHFPGRGCYAAKAVRSAEAGTAAAAASAGL
jgi:hypothetical protein